MSSFTIAIPLHEDYQVEKHELAIMNVALKQITQLAYDRTSQVNIDMRLHQDSESGKVELQMVVKPG